MSSRFHEIPVIIYKMSPLDLMITNMTQQYNNSGKRLKRKTPGLLRGDSLTYAKSGKRFDQKIFSDRSALWSRCCRLTILIAAI
jgi:hypothetical protein